MESLVLGQKLGVLVGINVLESCLFMFGLLMNLSELINWIGCPGLSMNNW